MAEKTHDSLKSVTQDPESDGILDQDHPELEITSI